MLAVFVMRSSRLIRHYSIACSDAAGTSSICEGGIVALVRTRRYPAIASPPYIDYIYSTALNRVCLL